MNDTLSSHEELEPLWKHLLRIRRADTAPFAFALSLGATWALANLPNLFSSKITGISLFVWGGYCVWALVLYVCLRLLSRKKTARSKRCATLLHLANASLASVLMSSFFLIGGLQLLDPEDPGKLLLLCLYGATLLFATLFGYHWFVLPIARGLNDDLKSRSSNYARIAGLVTPAGAASVGVMVSIILSKTAVKAVAELIIGWMLVTVAFVLAALGAGGLCETYFFARSGGKPGSP